MYIDCCLIHLKTLTKDIYYMGNSFEKQNAENLLHCNNTQQGDFNCGASPQADSELFPLKCPQISSTFLNLPKISSRILHVGWQAGTIEASLTDSTPFCMANYPLHTMFLPEDITNRVGSEENMFNDGGCLIKL